MGSGLAPVAKVVSEAAPPDATAIVNALTDAVLLIDAADGVCFANAAAELFFGAGSAVLRGRALGDLVQFDNPILALVATVRASLSTATEYNVDLLSPRTAARAVDAQVAALQDAPGWVLLSLRERSIADKLDRQLSHLGAARSVAGLAAALAHEVKNPLSGIRGAAQLLEQTLGDDDRELTALITAETDRICKLVDRMEMFSDERPLARRAVNIHEVLDHVRRLARSGFARRVRFVERYDPSLPPVAGDRDRLVQVFLNLIKNAAEAAPDPGGEIVLATGFKPGLRLSLPGGQGRFRVPLVVTVRDNGGGIPDDLKPHLFEPFVSGKAGGTGLGLPLVAKIVGDHGGAIEFDSRPGETECRVLLPLAEGEGGR